MRRTSYLFDTATAEERLRLSAHAELWDPFTFRQLAAVGLAPGWRCLEIGAGAGSVAAWLVDRVGPHGHVVATDIETRWLDPVANLEVRHHNIAEEALDDAGYDLVHARLVLEHLPRRDAVIPKLAAALRPGGWLVLEDYDLCTISITVPRSEAWIALGSAVVEEMTALGVDPHFGTALLPALRGAGLVDLHSEGSVHCAPPPALAPAFLPVVRRLADRLVAGGALRRAQVEEVIADLGDEQSELCAYSPLLVAARGRRRTAVDTTTHTGGSPRRRVSGS
jgi:SAM-dependent methyltransferase